MDIKEAIASFLFVPLGAFVTGTGTANGLWELIAGGCIMMIYGNLSIWGMIKEQNRIGRRKTIKL